MKDKFIDKIIRAMESEGQFIYENKEMSAEEKLISADILIDVIKFLQDYDENTRILNEYKLKRKIHDSWDEIEK